jgi:hypothetical protein
MCDYSLQTVRSRPARVGDRLTTRHFGTGTRGFASQEDADVAVCVLPGTELAFAEEVEILSFWLSRKSIGHRTAIFRQVNKDKPLTHHDALEFADGCQVLLTHLCEGQHATVLQLPSVPTTDAEKEAQRRVEIVA